MAPSSFDPAAKSDGVEKSRRMVRSELMGSHTHETICGIQVHIWTRDGKYLARGSYLGRRFGETLGNQAVEAAARLRRLLSAIEDGSYLRPSEARKRPLSKGVVPQLTLRELMNEYLRHRRQFRGKNTTATYSSRLMPVLDFVEHPENRKRWPLALCLDHAFAIELRSFLHDGYRTTRNGRPGGTPKPLSGRQIYNVLQCLRSMLTWARSPEIRKLSADWTNPLTPEIVGKLPRKNPLRSDPLPQHKRIALVSSMDRWQLCHFALLLTLPLRPEEATGLLVTDIDWHKAWLRFGTRMAGSDFTKGRQDFVVPFPAELRSILHTCVGERSEGPLLRQRAAFEGSWKESVDSTEELIRKCEEKLLQAPRGSVTTEQDRKQVFRRLLRELGGVSTDQLRTEFGKVLQAHGMEKGLTLYSLRHSVTTALHGTPGLTHMELRYLTGHTTRDILAEYVALDPVDSMQRYFSTIGPLLDTIVRQARMVGITA